MSVTIIAVGNGGFNLASDIRNANIFTNAQFLVCTADERRFKNNTDNVIPDFPLEKYSGKVESAMTDWVERIIVQSGDSIIICTALGGQTGSKYAPFIALAAKLNGKFVCSLFSMPYGFEGEQRNKRALEARMQLIAASNFVVQQNNERLKDVASLSLVDINKPLVETLNAIFNGHTFKELALESDTEKLQEFIPEQYRFGGMPLLQLLIGG